ncbi:13586_t:CDS:2, partial [Gigaspora margarita]
FSSCLQSPQKGALDPKEIVCLVFLKLYGISNHFLLAIQKHLQEKGLTKRTHGNTGHVPKLKSKVFLDSSITFLVKHFLEQYENINGLPSPMRHKNESEPFIYLPTGNTYTSVYNKFKKHFYNENSENTQIISYFTFRRLCDLCEVCKTFKAKLVVAKSDIEKYNQIKTQYDQYCNVVDRERQYYNDNINKSTKDLSIAHICYNWAQYVSVPYSLQQVGTIYFKNPFSDIYLGFSSLPTDIRKVYTSTELGGPEILFQILCENNFDINTTLKTIPIKLLTKKRKKLFIYKN